MIDIIQKLSPNKAHSHDMIGIRMLKICGRSICRPLELMKVYRMAFFRQNGKRGT